jgi:drug/metabolite transporter (DMT)-like permease
VTADPGWILPAVACATCYALSSAWQKAALPEVHARLIPFAIFAGGVPVFAVLIAREPAPLALRAGFWQPFACGLAINFFAYQLYARAIRASPISLTIPFLAFTPIVMPLTSWLIIGRQEVPGPAGVAGDVLVGVGAFLLHGRSLRDGPLAPLRAIAREPGTRLMLIVAACWTITANCDKAAVTASSSATYFFLLHVAFTLLFGLTLIPVRRVALRDLRGAAGRLLVLGLLCGATLAFQGVAYTRTRAPSVIAIKRSGLLISILIGCLGFKEGPLRERLPAGALMAGGAALVILAG